MNVNFAVQVLSSMVAIVLRNYYGKETHDTATICQYMENFFWLFKTEAISLVIYWFIW